MSRLWLAPLDEDALLVGGQDIGPVVSVHVRQVECVQLADSEIRRGDIGRRRQNNVLAPTRFGSLAGGLLGEVGSWHSKHLHTTVPITGHQKP